MNELPEGYTARNGRVYNDHGQWVEWVSDAWLVVLDGSRSGWWRHHAHYDRNGYCDNPGRGY